MFRDLALSLPFLCLIGAPCALAKQTDTVLSEVEKAEAEVTARQVEAAKADETAQTEAARVSAGETALQVAKDGQDQEAIGTAEKALAEARASHERSIQNQEAANKLLEQATKKYQLAKEAEAVEKKKQESAPGDSITAPLDQVLKKWGRLDEAKLEADLAQRKTTALREQLDTLVKRQGHLRTTLDEVRGRLSSNEAKSVEQRRDLIEEQQQLVEEGRAVSEQIREIREELLLAEATQRLKEEEATAEEASFASWKARLIVAAGLLLAVLVLMFVVRIAISSRVTAAHRRYYFNKLTSLLTTATIIVVLGFVFADQFANLLTLLGLALAGLTIALQEIVASFAAWFFIRGVRGYRTGDWIQIGDQYGEVIDIGFVRTIIQQVSPNTGGDRPGGGTPTGGLTVLMNNTVFKHPLVNFTRGYPYVWCSLAYTVTYESDWQVARELLRVAVASHKEITVIADKAAQRLQHMAGDYSLEPDSTQPVIRTWAADSGVELTVRFLVHPRKRGQLMDDVNVAVMQAVADAKDVEFAYHTIRSIPTPPPDVELIPATVMPSGKA